MRGRGVAYEAGLLRLERMAWRQLPQAPAVAIAPGASLRGPPGAISQVRDVLPVRPAAVLATALRAGEADHLGQLAPVDGVQPAVLRSDRHKRSLCQTLARGNPDVRPRLVPIRHA